MTHRRGFALLIVLWIVVSASALALAAYGIVRRGTDAGGNRMAMERARWRAADCLERARAVIDEALRGEVVARQLGSYDARSAWDRLNEFVGSSMLTRAQSCSVDAEPVGSRVDVNTADAELLRALLEEYVRNRSRVDSLVDAILDWRDADDQPRAHGAERSWYAANARLLPRDAPFAHVRELSHVRGLESLAIDKLFDVEVGRIALASAPPEVLAAVPGLGPEAADRIAELRARGEPIPELTVLAGTLPPAARAALLSRFAYLSRLTTISPDAWLITAHGTNGSPPLSYAIELRVVRAGDRAAVVRKRSWIE